METKDKVVTAESLSALHEYNKDTYVAKTDIMPIGSGGTGANTAEKAMQNLGVADYIVEQGKADGWTYRKWNSGKAECWIRKKISVACTKEFGGLYCSSEGHSDFPFYFNPAPQVNINAECDTNLVFVASKGGNFNGSYPYTSIVTDTSGTIEVTLNIYAIGTLM